MEDTPRPVLAMHHAWQALPSFCECACGKPMHGTFADNLALTWSSVHGFVASAQKTFLVLMHLPCIYQAMNNGQIGWFTLDYLCQPSPRPGSYAEWIQEFYPELVTKLATYCAAPKEAPCE